MDLNKMKNEMLNYGFDFEESNDEDKLSKVYKCYLSKKCNDEKYARIKKMFDFVKDDPKFIKHMGADLAKLSESFSQEARGQGQKKIDFDGMNTFDVFKNFKLGEREVCKKGYKVENDTYVKI